MSARRRRLSRTARTWVSVGATALGLGVLSLAALWVERSRNTDLTDERAGVTSKFRSDVPDDAPSVRFADVAASAGIDFVHAPAVRRRLLPEDTGSGVAWGDVDGDGDADLYFVDLGAESGGIGNRLFRNDSGRFTDVTDAAGVRDAGGNGMGASFADFDDDGDLDLYVTNDGPNRLFRNRGDGTFDEIGEAAGVADALWSVGAAWGDFDRDGRVDLYVGNYVSYVGIDDSMYRQEVEGTYIAPPALNPKAFDAQPNRLYRNRGDGTFEDVAVSAGVDDPRGRSLAATFADLDGDGRLDLYVNNDVSTNRLFLNRSDASGARFVDESMRSGTADPRGSMGLSVGDVSGSQGPDGIADLFITHWVAQENALYEGYVTPAGGLVYRDKARVLRLAEIATAMVGWGCVVADLDRDGRSDIVVVNGSTLEIDAEVSRLRPQPAFVFWNDGQRFHDLAPTAGDVLSQPLSARGLAACDFDDDGDIDLAVNVNRGAALLLRNDTVTPNRGLRVRLSGPAAALFGARVAVSVGARTQTLWSGSDVSYASQHSGDLVFGLGPVGRASRVEVRWADGHETVVEDPVGDRLSVTR